MDFLRYGNCSLPWNSTWQYYVGSMQNEGPFNPTEEMLPFPGRNIAKPCLCVGQEQVLLVIKVDFFCLCRLPKNREAMARPFAHCMEYGTTELVFKKKTAFVCKKCRRILFFEFNVQQQPFCLIYCADKNMIYCAV